MLRGFPSDFPTSFEGLNPEGMFMRSEVDDVKMEKPDSITKKVKIDMEIEQFSFLENNSNAPPSDYNTNYKHVRFSGDPPLEYFTFTEKEYDRSPLNQSSSKNKYKRYLIVQDSENK